MKELLSRCDAQMTEERQLLLEQLTPFARAMLGEEELAELTNTELADLVQMDITPDYVFGPRLLEVENQLRLFGRPSIRSYKTQPTGLQNPPE